MTKLRKKENTKIGYYAFVFKRLGKKSILDESFIFSTTIEKNNISASKYGEFAIFNADLLKDIQKADKFFLKTIKKTPKNAFWLGNYAIFLHYYKKDIKNSEKFYNLSIKYNSKDPFVIYNFAIFELFENNKPAKAEKLFIQAIELDPEYPKYKCTYAGFLFKVKKDFKKAEDLFKEIIDQYPSNPQWYTVYAQLKIYKEQFKDAEKLIDKAFSLDPSDDIKLQLWFYRYAHFNDYIQKAEFEMNKLLQKGVKTTAWGLQQNVIIAIFSGHKYPEKLENFSKQIISNYKI
jgi:Tfp pilus assembly protein PilF